MKYEYLTRIISLIATSDVTRGARLNWYNQYEGAYTALFLAQDLTTEEFLLYAEIGRFIVAELFE
jgi:hypothetical protein